MPVADDRTIDAGAPVVLFPGWP